ncbi:MAG: metallophosphoesterase [Fibrobacterota bacterium]
MIRFAVLSLFLLILSVAAATDTTSYRFVILGDRTGGPTPGVFERILDSALAVTPAPAFYINVGDLIGGYTRDTTEVIRQWKEVVPLLDRVRARNTFHVLPGNHDITYKGLEPYFERFCGKRFYSFDQGPDHFVVLDVSVWGSFNDFQPEQRAWLEADLKTHAKARHTFVFYHIPFWHVSPSQKPVDSLNALFAKYGVDYVVNGHEHFYRYGRRDNVTYVIVGSSSGVTPNRVADGSAYHYGVVEVNAKGARFTPVLLDGRKMAQDWMDTEKASLLNRLEGESFSYTPLDWRPVNGISRDTLRAMVRNPLKKSLPVILSWKKPDACAWKIAPDTLLTTEIKAGARFKFTTAFESGKLLPMPELSARFVFEGDTFDFQPPLLLQRSLGLRRVKAGQVTVDGKLDDAVWWQDATLSTHWFGNNGRDADSTWVGLAYDDKNFYIAFDCRMADSAGMTVRTPADKRDGIPMTDDHIRAYLASGAKGTLLLQFFFGPNGALNDSKVRGGGDDWADSAGWNGLEEYKTVWDKSGYRGEARFSLKELEQDLGKELVFNFRRYAKESDQRSSYQEPYVRNPKMFAVGRVK